MSANFRCYILWFAAVSFMLLLLLCLCVTLCDDFLVFFSNGFSVKAHGAQRASHPLESISSVVLEIYIVLA